MRLASLIEKPTFLRPAFLSIVLCLGCSHSNAYVAPPPPNVVVTHPTQKEVTVYHEYTGTTQPSESVEVRARVQGYLESIHFQDGAEVRAGDLLFVIDPRPYQAALNQAKAELEGKQAAAVQAESVYKRDISLVASRAVTQEQADIDRGNMLVAQAAVLQAQAALEQAQLNLDYTQIKAAINGRIGRRLVDIGNLVSPNTTLLTTVARYDPMNAYFNASETNYLAYLKRQRQAQADSNSPSSNEGRPVGPENSAHSGTQSSSVARAPIEMGLADEQGYPHRGYIDFANNTVDATTGTILVRAVFDNPEPHALTPGLFVRLRVPIETIPNAIVVPARALSKDQAGDFLLVVRPDNTVERRAVTIGPADGEQRVIERGLKLDDRFVLEGLQRARPGSKVVPQPAEEQVSSSR